MVPKTTPRTKLTRADRAEVQRYSQNSRRHREGLISSAEVAAFEALSPQQIDLLFHGEPPTRGRAIGAFFRSIPKGIATGAVNFRLGCSAILPSGASYLGLDRNRSLRIRSVRPR
ncbi:hypothetical protein B0I08_104139 [Glaciihabitans tibetensis]|uniref:Uncharacterized protein n=1 Tax=Glaciihabitans tibetensis TaxID=1266600 RepID=A0A2T0VE21_9MICO|nr:hypothetical protein B0I08_104139 [Glaciihabitans tibetensis]